MLQTFAARQAHGITMRAGAAVRPMPVAQPGGTVDDAEVALPAPAFFRLRDVLRITALTRPTLYRRIAAGRFPPPLHLGGRVCAWSRAALQSWIDDPENYRVPCDDVIVLQRPRGRPRKYVTA